MRRCGGLPNVTELKPWEVEAGKVIKHIVKNTFDGVTTVTDINVDHLPGVVIKPAAK